MVRAAAAHNGKQKPGGFFLYGDTFRSPNLVVCRVYSGESWPRRLRIHFEKTKPKTPGPRFLPAYAPGRRRSPRPLRRTPSALS